MFAYHSVVTVQSRHGAVDAVVVQIRSYRKGRNAGQTEYTLAPLNFKRSGKKNGKPFYLTCHERWVGPCKNTYSKKQIEEAVQAQRNVRERRAESERVENDRQWDAMRELEKKVGMLRPGDEVLIGYSNGSCWEEVAQVKPGKVGILRHDVERIRAANLRNAAAAYQVEQLTGHKCRRGQHREVRWLPATLIKDVRGKASA